MTNHPARSPALRRWYFVTLALVLIVCLFTRVYLFPQAPDISPLKNTVGSILDNVMGAIVVALFVGGAYVFLFPAEEAEALEVISSREIAKVIEDGTFHARQWSVRARTANYFSAVTLPLLTKSVLETGRSCAIRAQVLDPDNEKLMRAYAKFRSNHSGDSARWSPQRVQQEVYSAILQVALCKREAPRLDALIGLSPGFWVLSLDLSDDMALVTGQNRGESGLIFRGRSPLYSGWVDDFEASFTESRILTIEAAEIDRARLKNPSTEDIRRVATFFNSHGLHKHDTAFLKDVIAKVGRNTHYA